MPFDVDNLEPASPSPTTLGSTPPAGQPTAPEKPPPQNGFDVEQMPSAELAFGHSAPAGIQTRVLRASNEAEINAALEHAYGAGNFGKDEKGTWWVMQDVPKERPKPHSIEEVRKQWNTPPEMERRRVPVFGGFMQTTAAQMLAGGTPMAGAFAGATIGGMTLGPPGAVGGAFLGGAAGKLIDEGYKWWQDFYRKKPAEAVSVAVAEGAAYGAFEGLGPLAKYSASKTVGPLTRWWTGVTEEGQKIGRELYRGGAKPPIGVMAPEAKAMQYDVMIRDLLRGDPKAAGNVRYLGERMAQLMEDAGVPKAEVQQVMQEIMDRTFAVSSREADEATNVAVQRHLGELRASAESNMSAASRELVSQQQAIRDWTNAPPGNLAGDVQESIVRARRDFGRRMNRAAEDIHNMESGNIVAVWPVYDQAANTVMELEAVGAPIPPIIRRLADRAEDEGARELTIAEAHLMRTELRQAAHDLMDINPLAPGPAWRRMHQLANTIDNVFTDLAESGEAGSQASTALRQFDRDYRAGMQVFNDAQVGKLASMVQRQLPPDPEIVADMLFRPGYSEVARRVWPMLNPDLQARVATTYLRNIVQKVSDPVTGMMNGKQLAKTIRDELPLLEVAFPPQALIQLDSLAQRLAAIDGQMNINVANLRALPPSQFAQLLTDAVGQQTAIDNFAKAHPLKALSSGSSYAVDRAADVIINPANESAMENAFKFLGEREKKAVRDYALKKLLTKAITETPWKEGTVLGSQIEKELKRYTKSQQQLLFPDGLGDDLRKLARDARFLFPYEFSGSASDFGGSLAAANIKGHMPWSLFPYLKANLIAALIESGPMTRMFLGIKGMSDNYARTAVPRLLRYMIATKMLNQVSRGKGPQTQAPENEIAQAPQVESRQFGGPTNAMQPYVVGEQGPEVFVPQQSGTIVPNQVTQFNAQGNAMQAQPSAITGLPSAAPPMAATGSNAPVPTVGSMVTGNTAPQAPVIGGTPGGMYWDPVTGSWQQGMAEGGPVEEGASYVVGEQGPETFVPDDPYAATGMAQFRAATGQAPVTEMPPSEPQNFMDFAGQQTATNLANLFTAPGRAKRGELSQEEAETWGPQMAMTMAGRTPFAAEGSAGVFGGKLAKTADLALLERAKELQKNGYTRSQIWEETGWFQGHDKKWRFEISDEKAKVPEEGLPREIVKKIDYGKNPPEYNYSQNIVPKWGEKYKTSQVLEHPDLEQAYPGLGEIQLRAVPPMEVMSGIKGGFNPDPPTMFLGRSEPEEALSIMLHEMQHQIQYKEGFTTGASSRVFTPKKLDELNVLYKKAEKKLREELKQADINIAEVKLIVEEMEKPKSYLMDSIKTLGGRGSFTKPYEFLQKNPDILDRLKNLKYADDVKEQVRKSAFDDYQRVAGELEARVVQERHKMTDKQRLNEPPWQTEYRLLQKLPEDKRQIITEIPKERPD
jgi:hypothetical protein